MIFSYAIVDCFKKTDTTMSDRIKFTERMKNFSEKVKPRLRSAVERISSSGVLKKTAEFIKRQDLKARLTDAKEILVSFTKRQPKTAAFIYVCLFCSFSIGFLDKPFALSRLKDPGSGFWQILVGLNPSGWWFLILIALWLAFMCIAGLSLTTEVFEKNMTKARAVLFILTALSLSSLVTFLLNILTGRYIPEFLESMNLYGFSSMRFRLSETSFPDFGVQSIWVVAIAARTYLPRVRKVFYCFAGLVTLASVLTARCFISDAVMGVYIGVVMYCAAKWIVSENRENFPLISL